MRRKEQREGTDGPEGTTPLKNMCDPALWPLTPVRVRRDRAILRKIAGAQVQVKWSGVNTEKGLQRLAFRALIIDAKVSYQPFRTYLLITPVAGKGQRWIPLTVLDRFPDGKFYIFPNHPDWECIESLERGPKYKRKAQTKEPN